MIWVLLGIRAMSVSVSSTKSGIKDSMPSNEIPSLIFSKRSLAPGKLSLSSSAWARTVGVIRNSRQG